MLDSIRSIRVATSARVGFGLGLGLALALALAPGESRAQYAPGLPFGPYTSEYQAFTFPSTPGLRSGFVGPRNGLSSRGNAFDTYGLGLGALDLPPTARGLETPLLGPNGAVSPYASIRRSRNPLQPAYLPNSVVDEQYNKVVGRRDEVMAQMAEERDPVERVRLQKELERLDERVTSQLSSRRRGGPAPSGASRNPARPGAPAGAGTRPSAIELYRDALRTELAIARPYEVAGGPNPPPATPTGLRNPSSPSRASGPDRVLERSRRLGPIARPAPTP